MDQMSLDHSVNDKKILINNSSMNVGAASSGLTVEQLDIEILPVIYEIIRSIEKDPVEIATKQKESQDCSQKVLELQKRFESVRKQIRQLPGIDYNKEEQLQRLDILRNQLQLKQQLIKKILMRYLANNEQLVQRLSESYPVRRAAQLIVAGFYKTKHVVNTNKIADLSPEKFREFINSFKQNLKSEIEDAKQELKRRNKSN